MLLFSCKIKLPLLFRYVYGIRICRYSNKELLNTKMKILNVAEKNDAAKNIAGHLSGGNLQRREGFSKFNKIYEFNHNFEGSACTMVMTSVSGHLLGYEFQGQYRSWNYCSPLELFDIPVVKECPKDFINIKKTLIREVQSCNTLIIWTDADREGENIGFEIIQVCKEVNPRIQIYRAILSEITKQSVNRAMTNLGSPNQNISDAVDVRSELDLRIGAAFTRYQTMRLQKVFPDKLAKSLISYGSCQFPTLGFVVERYNDIHNFIPEKFWKIKVQHKIEDLNVEFLWQRVRLFDEHFCTTLYERCQENPTAVVLKVIKKPKSKWRPVPLDTIELEKAASRKLGINAKETMKIAEKLYSQGFISYPRTETNIFPKELNLSNLVQKQIEDSNWGYFAQKVLNDGPSPRQGKKSDQAHPPIHPTKYTHGLQDKERKVYEYVVRHFLACLSKDAEGEETIVNIDINGEKFLANGLQIIALNYLEVYPYDKWSNKQIHNYNEGHSFMPTNLEMTDGQTSPPNLLTEADLISLMDKHGIGTDATHAEHIETIKSRLYVGLENNKYFVPGELGIGLVEGYDNMGFEMSKPHLRAELEADLKKICEGIKLPSVVLREQIEKYKEVFIKTTRQVNKLDESLGKYLKSQPIAFQNNGQHESMSIMHIRKCLVCTQATLVLKKKQNNQGFFITCNCYPSCKNTFWLPPNVIDARVSNNVCSQCQGGIKLIKFQFSARSMRPHYPDTYEGCINGCDPTLCEILQVNISRNSLPFSSTQPSNRNITSYENTGHTRANVSRPINNFSRNTNSQPLNNEQVCCQCGNGAKLLTVTRETANKGRQFYGCSKPITASDRCNFFLWADDQPVQSLHQNTQFNNRTNVLNNNGRANNLYRARVRNNQTNPNGTEQRKCGLCKETGHTRRTCPQS